MPVREWECYVLKVESAALYDPDASPVHEEGIGDLVPSVTGGDVLVTAAVNEVTVRFGANSGERINIGDKVFVRLDYAVELPASD
jgi:hypothetical protein